MGKAVSGSWALSSRVQTGAKGPTLQYEVYYLRLAITVAFCTAQALTLNASRPETKVLSVRLWLLHASSSPAYLIRRLTLTLALSSLSLIQFIQSSPPLAERGPGRQSTSRPVSMAGPASPDAGPDDSQVPLLPTGWIAQWDSR